MPSRNAARPPSGRSTNASLLVLAAVMVLCSCTAGAGSSAAGGGPATGGSAAVSGLCEALASLPDRSTAERVFTNVAHEPLHSLAADRRLDRALSADILEAMQLVEEDFSQSADVGVLSRDLGALRVSAAAGLEALGENAPACGV
jgi:hypothetical protein